MPHGDAGRPPGRDDRARSRAGLRSRIAALDAGADAAFDRLRGNRVADRLLYGASALGDHSLIWFVVRDDEAGSDLLFKTADTT